MNELSKLLDLLRYAVEQGQTITLTADEVVITVKGENIDVTINGPSIGTES